MRMSVTLDESTSTRALATSREFDTERSVDASGFDTDTRVVRRAWPPPGDEA